MGIVQAIEKEYGIGKYQLCLPFSGSTKYQTYAQTSIMKAIQYRLRNQLFFLHGEAGLETGRRSVCDVYQGVRKHRRNRFFYLTDLRQAFPSVTLTMCLQAIYAYEESSNWDRQKVADFLKAFCFDPNGCLIVGASASPMLFDICAAYYIDGPLWPILRQHRLRYTRFVDNLTFSSRTRIGSKVRKKIRSVIEKAGFTINHGESSVKDLRKGAVVINGIGLENGGRLFLPRRKLAKINALLHRQLTRHDVSASVIAGYSSLFWHVYKKEMYQGRYHLSSLERSIIQKFKDLYRRQENCPNPI